VNETFSKTGKFAKPCQKCPLICLPTLAINNLSEEAKKTDNLIFSVSQLIVSSDDYDLLKQLYMSLRTYCRTYNVPRKSWFKSVVHKPCKRMMSCMKEQGLASVKRGYTFISNGMMFGSPPTRLTWLTETDIALISLARVDHPVLSLQGGPHQAITGLHSMLANDVSLVMRMMNWCKSDTDEQSEHETRGNENTENEQFEVDLLSQNEKDSSDEHEIGGNPNLLASVSSWKGHSHPDRKPLLNEKQ
jgi:hypothetical protein